MLIVLASLSGCSTEACPSAAVVGALDFDGGALGEPIVGWATVANVCSSGDALSVDAEVTGDGFTLLASTDPLPPGAAGRVDVLFLPETYAEHSGVLTLVTNNAAAPSYSLDLVGVVAADQDGDGHDAIDASGDDCDDADPETYAGAAERQDLSDEDCDGLVDEDFVSAGSLRVTEIMRRPNAVSDTTGEWIEVYNPTSAPIDLAGWSLGGAAGAVVLGPLVVPALGYAVLGGSTDPADNGGIGVDLAWPTFALEDVADDLSLSVGDLEVASVAYDTTWPSEEGRALALDYTADASAVGPGWWCSSTWRLPSGDYGTPGTPNGPCTTVDHDLDGYAEDDCDDSDPGVNPGHFEAWNEVDDDCDGRVDNITNESSFAPWVQSVEANGNLGGDGVAAGDLDADGLPELALGSALAGAGAGAVYVFDGEDWRTWAGEDARDLATAELLPTGTNGFGHLPLRFADHTGDGADDMLVADQAGGWALWSGALGDAPDLSTATTHGVGFEADTAPEVLAPDLDGDGVAEVVYGASEGAGGVWILRPGDGDVGPDAADAVLEGANDDLGAALATGDLDADGYDDLLVGAPRNGDHSADSGAVFVVPGSRVTGRVAAADVATAVLRGQHSAGQLGDTDTIALGDLDGDGTLDLAVSAHITSEVYVYFAAGDLSGTFNADTRDGLVATGWLQDLGRTVRSGDLNQDGRDDLVTAAGGGTVGTGLYVFTDLGTEVLLPEDDFSALFTTAASNPLRQATFADLDGDGPPELVMAAPAWGFGYGAVWVVGR